MTLERARYRTLFSARKEWTECTFSSMPIWTPTPARGGGQIMPGYYLSIDKRNTIPKPDRYKLDRLQILYAVRKEWVRKGFGWADVLKRITNISYWRVR